MLRPRPRRCQKCEWMRWKFSAFVLQNVEVVEEGEGRSEGMSSRASEVVARNDCVAMGLQQATGEELCLLYTDSRRTRRHDLSTRDLWSLPGKECLMQHRKKRNPVRDGCIDLGGAYKSISVTTPEFWQAKTTNFHHRHCPLCWISQHGSP
jgi:hypothetical protein